MRGILDQHATSALLESLQHGNPQLLREWENKSPEEQIAACRQIVYGTTIPAILDAVGTDADPDAVQRVVAVFESTFKNIENATQRSSSRSRSGSSSS